MKNNNYCVIMAGGIGSRFWPYSRNHKPKQFLDFFGTGRSLLQMTVDRFRPIIPIENMLVVTNVDYKDIILEQIPDMRPEQVLCEPARRNTAPCIAYAVNHIKGVQKFKGSKVQNEDVRIVVAASDHLIVMEEHFRELIEKGLEFVGTNPNILTLGMQPNRPETGYGYIKVAGQPFNGLKAAEQPFKGLMAAEQPFKVSEGEIYPVKQFCEKPNLETAKQMLASGDYLWNSGMFMFSLSTIDAAFHTCLPEMAAQFDRGAAQFGTPAEDAFIAEMFPQCENISIDYGVMEKAEGVCVMPADFGWSDLGTWGSLYDMSEKDERQNVSLHSDALFYESTGNIVTLESGKLCVVQGVDDMIVAEKDNVLLICKRAEEQRIKQMVADAGAKFAGKYN